MINEPLNKKELIKNIYSTIKEKFGFVGDRIEIETQVEKIISEFTQVYPNKCITCNKPNWELLAKQYGIEVPMEFVGHKCGYCSSEQPKKTMHWKFTEEKWETI